ncbi:MAG: hypothetical protein ACRD0X_04830, partial [Thermoanaerobaculia bacterium]
MVSISCHPRWTRRAAQVAVTAAVSVFLATAAGASVIEAGCLLEEAPPQGLNCTSNDLTFILVGLGTQADGCVDEGFGHCTPEGAPDPDPNGAVCTLVPDNCPAGFECRANDEVEIFLRAIVQNSTAQTRFDVGLWFSSDGDPQVCSGKVCSTTLQTCFTDAQCPGGETCGSRTCAVNGDCPAPLVCNAQDGARGGECGREMLHPTRVCNGGVNNGFPCDFTVECPGGSCDVPGHCTGLPFGRLCFTTVPDCSTTGGGTCTLPANTCPPLDLIGNDPLPPATPPAGPANGPYVVAESTAAVFDRCGDIRAQGNSGCDEDTNGLWDDTVLDFSEAVTLPCSDVDDDGFVNIPTCATWGNNEGDVAMGECEGGFVDAGKPCDADNQCDGDCLPRGVCIDGTNVGDMCLTNADCPAGTCFGNSFAVDTCDSEFEVFHNNAAKCRCENVNSNIPNPDLNLTCALPNRCTFQPGLPCTSDLDCTGGLGDVCVSQPSTVPPESEVLLSIGFTNPASAACDASTGCPGLPAERFQCATASFIRFDMDDQLGAGTFVNTPLPTPSETTGGTVSVVNPELVQWSPDSECGTPNIIGPNHAGTALVSYRVGLTSPDSVTLRARTFWSNEADLDPAFEQALQATCPINVDEDWASVADVRAYEAGGRVILEWRTTTEVQTRGFNVYRLDRGADRRVPLADGLVESPLKPEGSVYRVVDPQGRPGEQAEYLLVEEDLYGHRRALGPYAVTVGSASPARAKADELGLGARPALPSLAELRRLETSLR